jgi:intraflagellar transport protein 52
MSSKGNLDSGDASESNGSSKNESNTILFDFSKNEVKSPTNGFKQLTKKFKSIYKILMTKDELSKDRLEGIKAIIFAAPATPFDSQEISILRDYMESGGSVFILASEGGHAVAPLSHLNKFTEEYGITINDDSIVRTVYYKDFFHPKEVFIKHAAIQDSLDVLGGKKKSQDKPFDYEGPQDQSEHLNIVYPFGCTLKLQKPANPLLTSGALSFPCNRCLCAATRVQKGRLVVCGSVSVFDDAYINKVDNMGLATALFKFIMEDVKIESVDVDRPEYNQDPTEIPDTEALAERLRSCLQESEDLPPDFTQLFDHTLFKYDTHLIPEAVKLYERLGVKHEPLSLIPPVFDVPLPPLQPAVWMPLLREAAPPALDLFDLDDSFASEKLHLAQLTNKCTDADLEFFVLEAGNILGVIDKMKVEDPKLSHSNKRINAHMILDYVFRKLVNYKKMDQEGQNRTADMSSNSLPNPSSIQVPQSHSLGGSAGAKKRASELEHQLSMINENDEM